MKVVLILFSISLVALSSELKYYKKKDIVASATVTKDITYPKSDVQCCQACSSEIVCEGVKFDGTTCSILQNVEISTETSEEAWVQLIKWDSCTDGEENDKNCRIEYVRKLSLTVEGSSSSTNGHEPYKALTPPEGKNFWHSKRENDPWLALRMKSVQSNIIVVEVDDRKDSPEDSFVLERFQNVEVSVGTDSSINTAEARTSCGKQSYHGKGYKTYK